MTTPSEPARDLTAPTPRSGAEPGETGYAPVSPNVPVSDDDDEAALPAFLTPKHEIQHPESSSVFFRDNAYRAAREALTLAAVLVMVAGVAAAFIWPWLPEPPHGGETLAKYTPARDGDARLMLQTLGNGETKGWLAHNIRLIPGLRVATDTRKAVAEAFLEILREPGESTLSDDEFNRRLGAMTIIETRAYELGADGKVTESWQYVARDSHGDRFVAITYPQTNMDIVVSPPALNLPPDVEVGSTWASEGKLGNVGYTWRGRVLSAGRYEGAAGEFDDCLQIETQLAIIGGTDPTPNVTRDWYCAGLGWVEGHSLEPDGDLKQRSVWLGANGSIPADAPLPPAQALLAEQPSLGDADRWRMTRLGRARATGETSEASIQPTWIPTDPPLVLASGFGADLVAFETYLPGAPARWRFHTDGVVYGQPAFDPTAGRIYFGSSDKRVYALDTRGVFLWSFQTEDNVAARPVVAGNVVVAAGEDGKVYGIEAATGQQRWVFEAEDGIASWPALAGDVVVVGSDGQTVYGLDPKSGEKRWTLPVDGAVEAPIVVGDDASTVLVASRDGTVASFKPDECTDECKPSWSVKPGGALRTAPLVADDRVVVIDEDGVLIAVSKDDGKRLWSLGGVVFVGAAALAGDAIVASTSKGLVEQISLDGQRLNRWDAHSARSPADGEPDFTLGPVVGGDAIWVADTQAVVRRLGAPPIGEIPGLRLAWLDQTSRPPFASSQLRNTVAEHNGRAVVVEATRGIFLIDPANGSGLRLADLPGQGLLAQVDPVVVGDTLLTISVSTMQALDLRSGQLLWQGVATGNTIRPPVVAGQTVLWITGADNTGSLLALDLASGTMRWQASLGSISQVGGVVAGTDAAYTSTPPAAWDLKTGQQLWRATLTGPTIGGPALSPDGQTVYLSGVRADNTDGKVVALDALTGALRWQADIEDSLINPLDRLWAVGELVVIPGLEGKIIVLDAASGAERWRFEPPAARLGGITVERGSVWFMLENARLYGLDLKSGRPVARLTDLELGLNGMGLTQRPAFVGDRIIFPAGLVLIGLELPEAAP